MSVVFHRICLDARNLFNIFVYSKTYNKTSQKLGLFMYNRYCLMLVPIIKEVTNIIDVQKEKVNIYNFADTFIKVKVSKFTNK